jgi:hypothetical protein
MSVVFWCAAILTAVFLHFSSEKVPDPDVLYHFRHAEIYGRAGVAGLFSGDFPWLPYSVIGAYGADLWYGFHLLVIPFTWIEDPVLGLRLAGVFTTALFLFLIYRAYSLLALRPAAFWAFFLLFSSAFLLHRIAMLRPHVLSLSLHVLLFALLAAGGLWGVFLTALASTFLHLSLFVVSFLVFGIFAATKWAAEKIFPWRQGLALTGGILAGWILRPHPFGAAKIAYVQVFRFVLEKAGGLPLDFGSELFPLSFNARNNFWLFMAVWLGVLLFCLWKMLVRHAAISDGARTVFFSSAALSTLFLLMSLGFARRAFEFFSAFAVIFIGLAFAQVFAAGRRAWIAVVALFILLVPYSAAQRQRAADSFGKDPHRFESAARWMADHSRPGDIVFHASWDLFPELFFWNAKNFYVGGMDPIFQYARDPRLAWEAHHLNRGMTEFTCPARFCNEDNRRRTYRALKTDFNARYVLLAKPEDLGLYYYLQSDSGFELMHDDQSAAVFEIQ